MNSRSTSLRFLAGLVFAGLTSAVVWFGVGMAYDSTREHVHPTAANANVVTERAAAATRDSQSAPLKAQSTSADAIPNVNTHVAAAPPADFIESHYSNHVIADVKPADTPQQLEQKVRAMDPDYAKLLDENAARERATAEQMAAAAAAAPATPRATGNDSER
jgi:hypothetical protein